MASSYTEAELCRLMHLCAEGDHAAFEALVRHYEKSVFSVALSVLAHRQDAEDAAQETFLKLWRSAHTYRGDCSVKTWILTVARNTALDLKRGRKHTEVLPMEMTDGKAWDCPDDHVDSNPEASFQRKEEQAAVWSAMEALSFAHRQVLILRDMEGMTYEEIARLLKCREGTVKSRVARAREKLKNILKKRNFSF